MPPREPSRPDRRRSARRPLEIPVDYSAVDRFFTEFSANINEGGMFIETDRPAPVGTRVRLRFQLPGTAEPLKVDARVAWVSDGAAGRPPGMGVEFQELSERDRATINAVVRSLRAEEDESPHGGR